MPQHMVSLPHANQRGGEVGPKNARARIVGWMRTAYPMNRHALEWADAIEKCEDVEWSNAQHERSGDG